MGLDGQTVLDRFYSVLVREFGSRYPANVRGPLLVVDIKHNLVPYQIRREELGVTTIADYDRALLRLLDGQGGYVRLGSETARQKLRNHLDSLNPDPRVLSDFLSADVHFCSAAQDASRVEDSLQSLEFCPSCREALPRQAGVKFCPFCGDDVQRVLCVYCGEKLRLSWLFCVACGTGVESDRSH